MPRTRHQFFCMAVIAIFGLLTVVYLYGLLDKQSVSGDESDARPANSTLGFGAIYAVSSLDSPRRTHLLEAAAVTGIDITIPVQRQWTEEDIKNFKSPDLDESYISTGSIKAWLGHHVALYAFLESGLETALILEDDVDWDIRLRTKQIPIAQETARRLLHGRPREAEEYPWSSPKNWDLLYIGHCGDYFGAIDQGIGIGHHHPEHLGKIPYAFAPDPTMPMRTDEHPFTASLLTALGVPQQTRVLHKSQWPLCTFGYAITRRTAERLINELAPARESPNQRNTAYDAAVLGACRDGPLICFTLQPELFHHMPGDSLIAGTSDATQKYLPPVDAAGAAQAKYRGETPNIGCGFWSGDFYYEGDERKFRYLSEEVGRKGRCLKGH